ncbi:MAG TPA: DciA family protein [Rhodanobacteraceae bacterium]|jgi:hypothetical protein|nr:DciA family protein [Rhodanobacteraceae bacterium]
MIARVGENQRRGKTENHETEGTSAADRGDLGPRAPAAKIQRSRARTGIGDDYDVHAFGIFRIQVFAMQPDHRSSKLRSTTAKPVGESGPVTALLARARALDALDRQLRQPLPEALRRQCCLASVQSGRIVFLASSSAWAAKLRPYQNALIAQARVISGLPVEKFAVKVAPLPPRPRGQTRRKPLSPAAAEHLKTAARSLADPELRAVFLSLASLAEKSSS